MYLSRIVKCGNILAFTIALSVLSACSDGTEKYVICDDIVYVDCFNNEAPLKRLDGFTCDAIGLKSVKVVDSLLILAHGDSWTLMSLDAKHDYGTCLRQGEGPDELLSFPRCGASAFCHIGDSLMAYVCDKDRGKLFSLNITAFLLQGNGQLQFLAENRAISNDTWEAIPLGCSSIVASVPNPTFTGFSRIVITPDSIFEPTSTESWSRVEVKSEADINLLAKVTRAHPDGSKCVEAMLYLNQINLYSTDGSMAKTICVGSELDNLSQIESQFRFNRKDTYVSISAWELGFGAVYVGDTEKMMQIGESTSSEIHFFDWNGTPVFRARMPISVKAFDFDALNGILYAIDANEDTLGSYDATPILNSFNLTLDKQ